jgi:hypothetical protein
MNYYCYLSMAVDDGDGINYIIEVHKILALRDFTL